MLQDSRGGESEVVDSTNFAPANRRLFELPKPFAECEVCVVIPVRDEAENIAETLRAVTNQVDLRGQPFDTRRFEIIVFANNCRDETAAVARRFKRRADSPPVHTVEVEFPAPQANIGAARAAAMNLACQRLTGFGRREQQIILTTDGDTRVAPDWIAANLLEFERGADAVGGRILLESDELEKLDRHAARWYALDDEYRLLLSELEGALDPLEHDPNPRHHQHAGASFGVTRAAFAAVGGVPNVPHLEDHALYFALTRRDFKFRHSKLVQVQTSARRAGRTTRGFSTQLQDWTRAETADKVLVESVAELEFWFEQRRQLRLQWHKIRCGSQPNARIIEQIAAALNLESEHLRRIVINSRTFGAAVDRVRDAIRAPNFWEKRFPKTTLEQAANDARERIEAQRKLIG